FTIHLPATLATSRILLVAVKAEFYALPMEYIHSTRFVSLEEIFTLEGRESILVDGRPVSIVPLFDSLELRSAGAATVPSAGQARSCVVLQAAQELLAIIVDELLDE